MNARTIFSVELPLHALDKDGGFLAGIVLLAARMEVVRTIVSAIVFNAMMFVLPPVKLGAIAETVMIA